VLVVDVVDLVSAELADLAPAEEVALASLLRTRLAGSARLRRRPAAGSPGSAAVTEAHCCTPSGSAASKGRGVVEGRARRFSSSTPRRALRRSALRSSSSTRTVM